MTSEALTATFSRNIAGLRCVWSVTGKLIIRSLASGSWRNASPPSILISADPQIIDDALKSKSN